MGTETYHLTVVAGSGNGHDGEEEGGNEGELHCD